jgi:hypothetical protein
LNSKTAIALSNFSANGGRPKPEVVSYKSVLGQAGEILNYNVGENISSRGSERGGNSELRSIRSLDEDGFSDNEHPKRVDNRTMVRKSSNPFSKQYCVKDVAQWIRGKGFNVDRKLAKCDGCDRMHQDTFKNHAPAAIWRAIEHVKLLEQLDVVQEIKDGLKSIGSM